MQADPYVSSNAPSLGSSRAGSLLFEFCFLVRGEASVGGAYGSRFVLTDWETRLPGARPTKHISIEFEIR